MSVQNFKTDEIEHMARSLAIHRGLDPDEQVYVPMQPGEPLRMGGPPRPKCAQWKLLHDEIVQGLRRQQVDAVIASYTLNKQQGTV